MAFKHILITRFNIYYKTKMAQQGFDPEEWLQERFVIFQRYCFPSVINQSNLNFTWMIYVDSETSSEVLAGLKKMVEPFPFIMLIQREFPHFSLKLILNEDILNFLPGDYEYLISSRVDTDDMLHRDYIKEVQDRFNNQTYEAINFNRGHVYDIGTGVCSLAVHKHNPFISLIEKRSEAGFKSVFHQIHVAYKDDPKKVEVADLSPMWCMSVHGLNVSTSFYGRVIKFRQPNLKLLFGFEYQKKPTTSVIIQYSLRSYRRKWAKIKVKINSLLK